jgi:large conductance mechanosensitive channel
MSFFKEFRDFAMKGNVIDMAVGIVVGVAFNKIVSSLVNDVIMPGIGMLIAGVAFKDLKLVLKEGTIPPTGGEPVGEVAMKYGLFINAVIEFLIIAFTVFMVVRIMNRLMTLRIPIPPIPGMPGKSSDKPTA